MITFEEIKNNEHIKTYIKKADESLIALGYTEHSFAHVTKVSEMAKDILSTVLQQHFILNSLQVFNDKAFKLFLFLNLVIFRLRFHALCGIINIIVERWFSICI